MGTQHAPFVSVVTPVYNGSEYLAACIESVLAQTYRNFEYVIVDNWSTDDTQAIANRYAGADPRIVVRRPDRHLEIIANWNFALSCRNPASRYCKMVHADDYLMPACLERMVSLAESHPQVGIIGAYRLEENRPGLGGIELGRAVLPGKAVGAGVLSGQMSVFGSPTQILMRSEAMGRQPFFDESLLHADKDSCLRVLLHWDFGFVSEILTFTRRHNESKSSALRRLNPRRVENLVMLKRYGRHYLGERFNARWQMEMTGYHRYLAIQLLEGAGTDFWRFQRQRLAAVDERIGTARMARELIFEILNISDTARRLRNRFRDRFRSGPESQKL
jgi:glycosyltransferase involved in cell wall biosynthesis